VSHIGFERYQTGIGLLLLTSGALLVQGYHPFAEDAEIYLPGVEKILHPELFPVGREFFAAHASLTWFPNLVAFSLRVTPSRFEAGLFLWHLASVFLLLLACWELSGKCFPSHPARWCGVALVAALLTIPVAGTALYIMDQYLNPRNLAAFAGVFAVVRVLERKFLRALAWLIFAAVVHPLMAAFAFSYCGLLLAMEKSEKPAAVASQKVRAVMAVVCLLPFGISLAPQTSQAYHEAALHHGFHYIQRWQWYEWLGILAPLVLFWRFSRIARQRQWHQLDRMCRALMIYDLIYFLAALAVDFPVRFESLARLQPLRSLHLLYILMFLFLGGWVGEYLLKNRTWRWLALFVPLSLGMFLAQRSVFPSSAHLEWPGRAPMNEWAQAFLWVRGNTPVDALFALDPLYMELSGEDAIGFRSLAERSRLADAVKDSGAVSMFPSLADQWWTQVQALQDWKNFQEQDFSRLKTQFGVGWVVLQRSGDRNLDCPYQNAAVRVCRVP
jgi:hypothetical protein